MANAGAPDVYDFEDVDEMTLGVLAALREVRDRVAAAPGDAVAAIDRYAAEIVEEYADE